MITEQIPQVDCQVCGQDPATSCDCLECPVCHFVGDPECRQNHLNLPDWVTSKTDLETLLKILKKNKITVGEMERWLNWFGITSMEDMKKVAEFKRKTRDNQEVTKMFSDWKKSKKVQERKAIKKEKNTVKKPVKSDLVKKGRRGTYISRDLLGKFSEGIFDSEFFFLTIEQMTSEKLIKFMDENNLTDDRISDLTFNLITRESITNIRNGRAITKKTNFFLNFAIHYVWGELQLKGIKLENERKEN